MSEYLSTEFSVNVGELPNSPGLKVAARIGLGPTNSSKIKTEFHSHSGKDLEDATIYLVIPAKNAESAEDLRQTIQKTIDKGQTEEGRAELPFELGALIATSDDQEYEGTPKFVFSVEVHGSNVVVSEKLIAGAREVISASYETASALAGAILEKNNEVYLEFDAAKSVGELLHSNNKVLHALEALAFKLWIHLEPSLFNDLVGLVSTLGAPEHFATILGSLSLFASASFNLNFRSGNDLPEDVKESLAKLSQNKFNTSDLHPENIPQNVKAFFGHFANNGTGNVLVFAGYQAFALNLDLHVPGVSKFLAE